MKTEKIERLIDNIVGIVEICAHGMRNTEYWTDEYSSDEGTYWDRIEAVAKKAKTEACATFAALEAKNVEWQKENRRLREMLAAAHAGASLYTDDGELQDNREHPFIDFKRDSVDVITGKMAQRMEAVFVQCRKRAIELIYGGKCDNMTGAEVRQMLVDEFDEEIVTALALDF